MPPLLPRNWQTGLAIFVALNLAAMAVLWWLGLIR